MLAALSTLVLKILPIAISCVALYLTLHDRRPQLKLRARKHVTHNPYRILRARNGDLAFVGSVEVYNLSSRPNAVQDFRFWRKDKDGNWIEMMSQNYRERDEEEFQNRNETPVMVAAYSGVKIPVLAFAPISFDKELKVRIRIEIQDLFDKRHQIEVTAVE